MQKTVLMKKIADAAVIKELDLPEKFTAAGLFVYFVFYGYADYSIYLGALLMLVGFTLSVKDSGISLLKSTPLIRPLTLLFLIALLSLFRVENFQAAGTRVGDVLEVLIVFLPAYHFFRNKSSTVHGIMLFFLLVGGGLVVGGDLYRELADSGRKMGPVIENSNLRGVYLLFVFSLSLTFLSSLKLKLIIPGIPCIFLLIYGVLASTSRAAILGMMAACIFFIFLHYLQFSNKKIVALFLIVMLLAFPLFQDDIITELTDTINNVRAREENRIYIWLSSAKLIRDNPLLGVGAGNFRERYEPHPEASSDRIYNHSHNIFVQFGVEVGVAGMLVLLSIIGAVIKHFYLSLPLKNDFKGGLQLALAGAMAGFFVQTQFEYSLISSAVTMLLTILLAWLLALSFDKIEG